MFFKNINVRASALPKLALLFVGTIWIVVASTQNVLAQRSKINFNRDWKFKIGDHKGAEATTFKDQDWEHISLPHSFSMPYFMSKDFYTGYGWYRKTFKTSSDFENKHLFLDFEGAFQDAEIFLNGERVGEHKGGYTGFSIDITDAVKSGDNVLAVRLNNLWNSRLAPRAGEHVFSGGIYRDVYLVVTNPVHVDWYGTYVTTPLATPEKAIVNIQTDVRNDGNEAKSIKLRTDILDPQGHLVSSKTTKEVVAKGSSKTFSQNLKAFSSPQLWSPEKPVLYKAVQTLVEGGKTTDVYETTFGVRSLKWTADSGFYLNSKHYYLRGANVHQDHAGWGDAVTNTGFYRDVKMMKDAGFNFIRGSHYPHDPSFIEACDELGMLFWSENAFWGIGGFKPEGYWNASAYPTQAEDQQAFEQNVLQQLTEMIKIFRNHPSIIAWSISNEPFFSSKEVIGKMRELLKKQVTLSHKLDPSRPAAIGGAQRPLDENRIDNLGDIAGYNGDGASIPVFQNPGFPTLVSEYSSTTADRPGVFGPQWGDLSKDKGEPLHTWRSGQAIWCGFDHGSIAGETLGKMGIVDYFRIPKQAYYWYRQAYTGATPPKPHQSGIAAGLKLVADRTVVESINGTEDVQLLVSVLDEQGNILNNTPSVKFSVVSGPGEFPTGRSILFEKNSDIRIMDGQAAIEFRSYFAGKTVIVASSPGIKSDTLELTFKGNIPYSVSQKYTEKPYIRFERAKPTTELVKFGPNNPAFSSSVQQGSSAGLGVDANPDTYWQASENDPAPEFILDTEKNIAVKSIKLLFPSNAGQLYRIETSKDRKNWQLLTESKPTTDKEAYYSFDGKKSGRFIRICFRETVHAKIAELEVTGIVSNK
ncbi:glycoside hydrolase family 2 TIM barrel-domain containing protein [Pelobium manganitolerans]|uniref:glycoside hydrolase family 2 protein n=1 Tax=Pelobium manganitolerans TaxID=1842495 RepID=UPI003FA3AA7E